VVARSGMPRQRIFLPGRKTKDVWKLRTMSMKKTTSTTLSTTSSGMSAIVFERNAALYGTMTT